MTYAIIQPPVDRSSLDSLSKEQLIAYRNWFDAVMPERIAILTEAVKTTPGFENWASDLTAESLGALGEWFRTQVEVRKRTKDQLRQIKSKLPYPIDIPDEDLTAKTFSIAIDVGIYFGQVILKNVPGTRWDQILRNKKNMYYGHPVIAGFGKVVLNPLAVATTIAYLLAAKKRQGDVLLEAYDVWAQMKD